MTYTMILLLPIFVFILVINSVKNFKYKIILYYLLLTINILTFIYFFLNSLNLDYPTIVMIFLFHLVLAKYYKSLKV